MRATIRLCLETRPCHQGHPAPRRGRSLSSPAVPAGPTIPVGRGGRGASVSSVDPVGHHPQSWKNFLNTGAAKGPPWAPLLSCGAHAVRPRGQPCLAGRREHVPVRAASGSWAHTGPLQVTVAPSLVLPAGPSAPSARGLLPAPPSNATHPHLWPTTPACAQSRPRLPPQRAPPGVRQDVAETGPSLPAEGGWWLWHSSTFQETALTTYISNWRDCRTQAWASFRAEGGTPGGDQVPHQFTKGGTGC